MAGQDDHVVCALRAQINSCKVGVWLRIAPFGREKLIDVFRFPKGALSTKCDHPYGQSGHALETDRATVHTSRTRVTLGTGRNRTHQMSAILPQPIWNAEQNPIPALVLCLHRNLSTNRERQLRQCACEKVEIARSTSSPKKRIVSIGLDEDIDEI